MERAGQWPSLPLLFSSRVRRLLLLKSFQWNEQSNGAISEIIPIPGDANGGNRMPFAPRRKEGRKQGRRERRGEERIEEFRPLRNSESSRLGRLPPSFLPSFGQLLAALCQSSTKAAMLPPLPRPAMNCPSFGPSSIPPPPPDSFTLRPMLPPSLLAVHAMPRTVEIYPTRRHLCLLVRCVF